MRKYIILLISIVLFHCTLNTDSIKIKPKLIFYERENDSKYSLSEPSVLFLDNDANFYLLTLCDGTIKKYDKNGRFVKQFCKRGPGPGELSYPPGANIIDDNLYIIDMNYRKHLFDTNGKFIKTGRYPVPRIGKAILIIYRAKSINDSTWVASGKLSKGIQMDQGWTSLALFTNNGNDLKEIYSFDRSELNVPNKRYYYGSYVPDIAWDVSSNGDIYYARMDEYTIYKFSRGKKKIIISEKLNPIMIDNNIKKWAGEENKKDPFGYVPLPKNRNMINQLCVDEDSRLWVLTNTEEFRGLRLYSSEGKFLRSFKIDKKLDKIKPESLFFYVAANYLFFSIYDDLEGQKIYRSAIKVK